MRLVVEVSLILKKFEVTINDDSVPPQDTIVFATIDSWDLSSDLMGDAVITRQLESDAVFNFATSYINITLSGSSTLTAEFTRANLEQYTYGVEISGDGVRRFVGQIDQTNVTYNPDAQIWEFKARDWYKYFYDILARISWNYLSQDLSGYLEQTFCLGQFLQLGTIDMPFRDPNGDDWGDANSEIEILIDYKLLSRTDYLVEVIKNYAGFFYVDADYKLNFINRSRQTPPIQAVAIDILDQTTAKTYLRDSFYDGILVSQKTQVSPTISEISWKLLRYINGEVDVTTITDPDQLNQITGLRVLDLRQKLGAIASGSGTDITYTWGYRMGYVIFPQRDYADTLADYRDLFQKPILIEIEIEHTDDMNLISHIFHDDGSGNVEYVVEYIEEDLVSEKMMIRAKEYFRNSL